MDKMKAKRMEIARKLSQQHPQVEDFEAAGGDVEDLPGKVSVPRDEFDRVGDRRNNITAERMRVAKSLVGGETPEEAMKTARAARDDTGAQEVDVAAMQLREVLKGLGVSEDTRGGGGVLDQQVDAINRLRELEEKGLLSLSDELKAKADKVLRSIDEIERFKEKHQALGRSNDMDYGSKAQVLRDMADEEIRDLELMMKDIYEETPFGKRAKAFQEKNPGKPYREEGGE